MERSRIWRQTVVFSGLLISSISEGMVVGQISGMIAALQSNHDDVSVSKEVISWIVSTSIIGSLIGLGLAAFISTRYGRGKAISILTIPIILTWIMVYYGNGAAVFIITRALIGIFSGGTLVILCIATGEYAPANKRPFCLYIVNSVALTFGTTVTHILCILFHWRTVALISIFPAILAVIIPYFWVESPSWLASKGRFEECEVTFRSLHGYSDRATEELNLLLKVEKLKQSNNRKEDETFKTMLSTYLALFTKRPFWNLCSLSVATIVYKTAAGKYFFITLAITILKDLTGRDDILYFTLVVDGFFLLGTCISCLLITRIRVRTLLFSSSIISIILLMLLSACNYFNFTLFINLAWTKCILLALYFIIINAGPYPILDNLYAEMYPSELKGYYTVLLGFVVAIVLFVNLKFALDMVSALDYHGLFLLNIFFLIISLIFMWYRLPETKGRTIHEIELFFEKNTFDKVDEMKKEKNRNELVTLMDRDQEEKNGSCLA